MNLDNYSYGILILFRTVEDTTLILLYILWMNSVFEIKL